MVRVGEDGGDLGVGRCERRSQCLVLERGKVLAPGMEREHAWCMGGGMCGCAVLAGEKCEAGIQVGSAGMVVSH